MFVDFVIPEDGFVRSCRFTVAPVKCPKNCSVLIIVIGVLLGLNPTLGAPTNSKPEWLTNPCGRQPQVRHGRSAAENQLKSFIKYIDVTFLNELNKLYKPAQNLTLAGTCLKINKMLKPIKAAATKTLATQAFYETLLQIAIFIDKLKDIPIKTDSNFNHSQRKYIFNEAKDNLRLLICEFNDTLAKYENKNILLSKPRAAKINMKCLPNSLNVSSALVIDIDFFKKIKKFLKQSRRSLKRKRPKAGNAVNKKSVSRDKKRTKSLKH